MTLLKVDSIKEGERVLRETYEIRKSKEATGIRYYYATILYGSALVQNNRFKEAEPLLTESSTVLAKRWSEISLDGKPLVQRLAAFDP